MKIPNPLVDDPIRALASKKFPEAKLFSKSYWDTNAPPELVQVRKQAEAYMEELEKLPAAELEILVEEAKKQRTREYEAKQREFEENAFHNSAQAQLDILFWQNLPFWSVYEAMIVSTGRDPRQITLEYVDQMRLNSPYYKIVIDRLQTFKRLVEAGLIHKKDAPINFINVARLFGFSAYGSR